MLPQGGAAGDEDEKDGTTHPHPPSGEEFLKKKDSFCAVTMAAMTFFVLSTTFD